jgi:hypothetical protein
VSTVPFLLGDAETQEVLAPWRITDPAILEWIMIFGAIGLVTLLVLLWAAFLRKRRRRRSEHSHSHRHSSGSAEITEPTKDESATSPAAKRRHRRRSGRRHRSRNPTLAETGGLPPVRPEGPSESEP